MLSELSEGKLTIKVKEEQDVVKINWRGKSNDRNPSKFLSPFFDQLITTSQTSKKRIEMDFVDLDYMNSSTITPVVQFIDQAKDKSLDVIIRYSKDKSWQEISFTAIKFLESAKPLIQVEAI